MALSRAGKGGEAGQAVEGGRGDKERQPYRSTAATGMTGVWFFVLTCVARARVGRKLIIAPAERV